MRKPTLREVALFAVGLAIGWRTNGAVVAQSAPSYRVINENNGEKIERELNEIVRVDPTCKVVLGLSGDTYVKSKIILECKGS